MLKATALFFYSIFILSFINHCDAQVKTGVLLDHWSDTTLVSSETFDNVYNEIWGVTVRDREYAVLGTSLGTHFIDVTNPSDIEQVYVVEGGVSGREIIHRDFHDYNGYLYAVADEGLSSSLQIMDLSYLPDSVSVIYDSSDLIQRTHNIFIDSSAAILYACISDGDNLSYAPIRLFDISTPGAPEVINDYRRFGGIGINQVHDAYVRKDTAFLNCGNTGLMIVDFKDPNEPILLSFLGTFNYPQSGYNHSGWLSEDGNTYIFADETWGQDMKVLDVSNILEPEVIDTIDAESNNPLTIPHNQIIHGKYLYAAYYYDGLQVWDIEDPTAIKRVLQYPTSSRMHARTYEGAWGIYPFLPSGNILVSDMQEGLFVIEGIQPLSTTQETSTFSNIKIYPNPTQNEVNIEGEAFEFGEIYSSSGDLLYRFNESKLALDLPSGNYIIKLFNNDASSTHKLTVIE